MLDKCDACFLHLTVNPYILSHALPIPLSHKHIHAYSILSRHHLYCLSLPIQILSFFMCVSLYPPERMLLPKLEYRIRMLVLYRSSRRVCARPLDGVNSVIGAIIPIKFINLFIFININF